MKDGNVTIIQTSCQIKDVLITIDVARVKLIPFFFNHQIEKGSVIKLAGEIATKNAIQKPYSILSQKDNLILYDFNLQQ